MKVICYRPAPPLDAYVECFWYAESNDPARRRERALPTGAMDLVFSLHADCIRCFASEADVVGHDARGAIVHGAQSRYFVLDAQPRSKTAGVHFRPGGGAALLGVPAGELTDRHIGLDALWGARAQSLREQLLQAEACEGAAAVFAALERALRARRPAPFVHPAIGHALRSLASQASMARVQSVRDESGYGAKRFIALFRDAVGLTPKRFARIRRLQAVVERVARGPALAEVDWAEVALDGGYCDQSHLIRDFRGFAGVTPGAYRPVAAERPQHMAIDD
jgi:AraC-like DNA-binding protein